MNDDGTGKGTRVEQGNAARLRDFDGWARRAADALRAGYDYSGSDAEEDPRRYLVDRFLGRPEESDWPLFLGGAEGVPLFFDATGKELARGACARLVGALVEEDALDVVPAEANEGSRVALRFMVVRRERAAGRARLGEARVVARVSLDDPRTLAVEEDDEYADPPYRGLEAVYGRLAEQAGRAAEAEG